MIEELFSQEEIAETQAAVGVEASCIHPLESLCPDDGIEQRGVHILLLGKSFPGRFSRYLFVEIAYIPGVKRNLSLFRRKGEVMALCRTIIGVGVQKLCHSGDC